MRSSICRVNAIVCNCSVFVVQCWRGPRHQETQCQLTSAHRWKGIANGPSGGFWNGYAMRMYDWKLRSRLSSHCRHLPSSHRHNWQFRPCQNHSHVRFRAVPLSSKSNSPSSGTRRSTRVSNLGNATAAPSASRNEVRSSDTSVRTLETNHSCAVNAGRHLLI